MILSFRTPGQTGCQRPSPTWISRNFQMLGTFLTGKIQTGQQKRSLVFSDELAVFKTAGTVPFTEASTIRLLSTSACLQSCANRTDVAGYPVERIIAESIINNAPHLGNLSITRLYRQNG